MRELQDTNIIDESALDGVNRWFHIEKHLALFNNTGSCMLRTLNEALGEEYNGSCNRCTFCKKGVCCWEIQIFLSKQRTESPRKRISLDMDNVETKRPRVLHDQDQIEVASKDSSVIDSSIGMVSENFCF